MYSVICTNEILDLKSTATQTEFPRATLVENDEWHKELKALFDPGHCE